MNIQAVDGNWYSNPAWVAKNYVIQVEDDYLVLKYKGRVLWNTARRVLSTLGLKAKLDAPRPDNQIILNGRLVLSSIFRIKPIRPIPVPILYTSTFSEAPEPLFNGRTLSWKRSGQRWMSIGETF